MTPDQAAFTVSFAVPYHKLQNCYKEVPQMARHATTPYEFKGKSYVNVFARNVPHHIVDKIKGCADVLNLQLERNS